MGQPAMLACSHKIESMSSQDASSPESVWRNAQSNMSYPEARMWFLTQENANF